MNARDRNAGRSDADAAEAVPFWDRAIFIVLSAVLCARPLIAESFERAAFSFLPADAGGGTTPATTVWLDGILLLAAVAGLARQWRSAWRFNVTTLGLGLLLAAVVVSVSAAADKRVAANAGAHLFVMALAGVALVRIMRARWMVHLLIAAVVAGGVTNAVKCVTQRAYEFDDSLEYWLEQEPARLAAGVDPTSPALVNYERRLRSNEAFGHLAHSNVTASCLAMGLLVGIGVLIGVLRRPGLDLNRRLAAAFPGAALAGALAVGLWLTTSVGAAVAAVTGVGLLLVLGAAQGWIASRPRRALAILVGAYAAVIAAGAGYGCVRGTLPHTSLAFRWQYWEAAGRAFGEAPLTGIGRENFRSAYLLHKSPEGTEEVGNPHNLWLSLLIELGPLGLGAGALLFGGAVLAALRGLRAGTVPPSPARATPGSMVALMSGVLGVQALASGTQFGAPGILLLWIVLVMGAWGLGFLVACQLLGLVAEQPRASTWLSAGLCAALGAALIQNLIGFSLLTPAGLSIWIGLAAAAAALHREDRASAPMGAAALGNRDWPAAGAVGGIATLLAFGWLVLLPTVRSQDAIRRVELGLQTAADPSAAAAILGKADRAIAADAWDAETPRHVADLALRIATSAGLSPPERAACLARADADADVAAARNPRSFALRQLQASLLQARLASASGGAGPAWSEIASAWDRAVAAYPTNPRTRIDAGLAWFQSWKQTEREHDGQLAAAHFQRALAIDETRLPEVAVKLREAELAVIRACLEELGAAGFRTQPARAAPP